VQALRAQSLGIKPIMRRTGLAWSSGVVEGTVNRLILWNQNCQVDPEGLHATRSRVPG
jgi:hypothetical protein